MLPSFVYGAEKKPSSSTCVAEKLGFYCANRKPWESLPLPNYACVQTLYLFLTHERGSNPSFDVRSLTGQGLE